MCTCMTMISHFLTFWGYSETNAGLYNNVQHKNIRNYCDSKKSYGATCGNWVLLLLVFFFRLVVWMPFHLFVCTTFICLFICLFILLLFVFVSCLLICLPLAALGTWPVGPRGKGKCSPDGPCVSPERHLLHPVRFPLHKHISRLIGLREYRKNGILLNEC